MTITQGSWHFKAFLWFKDRSVNWRPDSVNLCPYVRAVFIWAPLAWLFVRGKAWKVPVAAVSWFCVWLIPHVIAYRAWAVATLHFLAVEVSVVIAAAILVGSAIGISQWKERKRQEHREWLKSQMTAEEWERYLWVRELPARLRTPEPERRERFTAIKDAIELLGEYARAIHNKICPIIQVK